MRKRGQPTKYRKEYCKQLIEHMSQGLSFDTFCGVIGVCRDSTYEWLKHHKDFSDAKAIGSGKRNLLVEKIFVGSTTGKIKGVNPAQLIYWTKNTLGWSDQGNSQADGVEGIEFEGENQI